jgi:hypothetical protein
VIQATTSAAAISHHTRAVDGTARVIQYPRQVDDADARRDANPRASSTCDPGVNAAGPWRNDDHRTVTATIRPVGDPHIA